MQRVTVSVVDPNQRNVDLRVLAVVSVIALALMAAVSMGLGWLLAGRVLASEQQLEELIEALLSLAVSERGLDRREPVDLTAIVGDVHAEIERRGLRLQVKLDPARVEGDPQLIERPVANLLDNAIGHNASGGRVEVTTATSSGGAALSVTNDGPVIPPQELERLRRPFQRFGIDCTDRGDGHGLGLSIVQAIADAHGAALAVNPLPAGGLHAEVRFPDASHPPGG